MIGKILLLAACLLPLGCSQSTEPDELSRSEVTDLSVGGVILEINGTSFQHGDTVHLRLTNGASHPVGYNLCYSYREKRTAEGWDRIEWLRLCADAIFRLEPGAIAPSFETVEPDWGEGRYRIVTLVWGNVDGNSGASLLTSAEFDVGP